MKSLIIQSDFSIMLETKDSNFDSLKDELIKFSEMDQSPDSVYIYKITDLSIWNAISMGIQKDYVLDVLEKNTKYPLPKNVIEGINKWYSRYGVVSLDKFNSEFYLLEVTDSELKSRINNLKDVKSYLHQELEKGFLIKNNHRGEIKSVLMKNDISVHDKVGFSNGDPLNFIMRENHLTKGFKLEVRDYQEDSAQAVYLAGAGCVTLPCGSGKTMVGTNLAVKCQTTTLIVTNSSASVKQWKQTLLDFTTLTEDQISCYTAKNKTIAPVTICTYSMIAYRYKNEYIHFNKLIEKNWGLLILDEVHLMPAAMFRIVASFQSSRRLALTATFVREDKREKDIFTLIGPKRYEKPWKDLEARGYIAKVSLQELRVPMSSTDKDKYTRASSYQEKIELATMSENKIKATRELLDRHKNDKVLIIGQFTNQLERFARELNVPVVHGENTDEEREFYYDQMRDDKINVLIASSIANAALDIPGINVVIQVSFQGGSRSEECQRVGRATRPKEKESFLYTLVSKDTVEERQNFNRQRFLTSEGYQYEVKEMAIA
jgi:DNA excision repair protein ERCC-3